MAKVKPFKGILYNTEKTGGNHSSVCAPPYDVIPPAMRDRLYESNEYNIIKLILGKSGDKDNTEDNQYTRAGRYYKDWIDKGVLKQDEEEAYYIYQQEYKAEGRKCRRTGFIGLMEIEDPDKKGILPHENTLAAPKEDRMNLIQEVRSNLSPIFTIFLDKDGSVKSIIERTMEGERPIIDIEIDGEAHRLWRLSDKQSLERISALMEDRKIFIADGHHRYEVARKYRDMMRQDPGYDGSADDVMMYFADMEEGDNLTVLATHRVVRSIEADDETIKSKLGGYFDVKEWDDLEGLMADLAERFRDSHIFGYYGGGKYLSMELKNEGDIEKLVDDDKSLEWKKLDVSILHSAIFRNLLGVKAEEGNIKYVKTPEEAVSLVESGSAGGAFFLNPTRVEQLKAVAENGDMMPQKSTYFYPKLLTGLVINRFGR